VKGKKREGGEGKEPVSVKLSTSVVRRPQRCEEKERKKKKRKKREEREKSYVYRKKREKLIITPREWQIGKGEREGNLSTLHVKGKRRERGKAILIYNLLSHHEDRTEKGRKWERRRGKRDLFPVISA